MKYLIAYDVTDDKLRGRLARHLEGLGRRLQKSLFIADLGRFQVGKLRDDVARICGKDKVDVILVPLCQGCEGKMRYLGEEKRSFEIF